MTDVDVGRVQRVREWVEGAEKIADEWGWDSPPELHRVYYDLRRDSVAAAIVPLHYIDDHVPSALQVLAEAITSKVIPVEVWPKVGEFALFCMSEAWMAQPQEWSDEFTAAMSAAREERERSPEEDPEAAHSAVLEVYRRFYGEDWSMADVQGSVEVRHIEVVMGKTSMTYQRVRGQEPMWLGEGPGEDGFKSFGAVKEGLLAIQRASRAAI